MRTLNAELKEIRNKIEILRDQLDAWEVYLEKAEDLSIYMDENQPIFDRDTGEYEYHGIREYCTEVNKAIDEVEACAPLFGKPDYMNL